MKHLDKIEILKNVASGWFGFVVNVATGLLLSPYILHRLGDDAFGLWVLVFAITGYYGLFDFGIRSSVVRYVAKFNAVNDREHLDQIINTSLFSYSCVGFLLVLLTIVGALFIQKLFHVPDIHQARLLFLLVGGSLAVGFPFAVIAGILEGIQKFYISNLTNVTTTILRALLIVVALHYGYGLLTIAAITAVIPLTNGVVNTINVLRLTPLRLGRRFVTMGTFKTIFNYGSVTFMVSLASRLRFKSDAVIIGSFISAAAVTQFAIGSRLVDYATDMVDSLAQIFTPMSSHLEAKGDIERLRAVYIEGNRACALVIFPMCAGLIIMGKSVIQVWMGAKYVAVSYPVMLVLLIPSTLRMAQATSGRILYGIARHKMLAIVTLLEGLLNLVLSIILVRSHGIIGDAYGTAIPLTLTCIFFLPTYLCHLLGLKVRTFLRKAYTAPLLLCLPMIAVLISMQHWFVPHTLLGVLVQVLAAGGVYVGFVYYFMVVKGPLNLRRGSSKQTEAEPEAVVTSYPGEG